MNPNKPMDELVDKLERIVQREVEKATGVSQITLKQTIEKLTQLQEKLAQLQEDKIRLEIALGEALQHIENMEEK